MTMEVLQPTDQNAAVINGARESRERSENGIKIFRGAGLPNHPTTVALYRSITAHDLRDARFQQRRVWLPEETVEAARFFFEEGRINIIGEPQSGKGTILYGLSEICHRLGWGYMFVDGHHQETSPEFVIRKLREAQIKGIPILYDSFDYAFAKGKKREVSLAIQRGHTNKDTGQWVEGRTRQIIEALDSLTVPIAITHHDEVWAKELTDTEFREQFRSYLDRYPVYRMPSTFTSEDSAFRFLTDSGLTHQQAQLLLRLDSNPYVANVLQRFFAKKDETTQDSSIAIYRRGIELQYGVPYNVPTVEEYLKQLFRSVHNYAVLKELIRGVPGEVDVDGKAREGRGAEFMPLLKAVTHAFLVHKIRYFDDAHPDLDQKIERMAEIILESDCKRVFLPYLRKR